MALKLRKSKVAAPICPLSTCMTLLGGAWTPNIVWYLSSGARRFGELRVDIPDISAKVLSGRLRELAAKRLVTRRVKPTSPPSVEYELTELGKELLPAIVAIAEVGKKLKSNDVDLLKLKPARHPRKRDMIRPSPAP